MKILNGEHTYLPALIKNVYDLGQKPWTLQIISFQLSVSCQISPCKLPPFSF